MDTIKFYSKIRLVRLVLLFLLFINIGVINTAYASKCVTEDKGFRNNPAGRGWFWGERLCEPVEEKDNSSRASVSESTEQEEWNILPEKANIPWEILDKLDPDEIANKIEPQAKKVAVMYPTDENIAEYRKLSRWILLKSKEYMNRDMQVRTENPEIMPEVLTAGTSEYRNKINRRENDNRMNAYLQVYTERARLVVYTRAGCPYCDAQRPILDMFREEYGWIIMERALEEFPEEQIRYNVRYTPDIFLLLNTPEGIKYQRIATGLTTLADLKKQVIYGLQYLGEDVSYSMEVSSYDGN